MIDQTQEERLESTSPQTQAPQEGGRQEVKRDYRSHAGSRESSFRESQSSFHGRFGSFGRKSCPFSGPEGLSIDYKDVKLLSRFVTERGKIMPRRITYVKAKPQRELSIAIKRARYIALMPYVSKSLKGDVYESGFAGTS